MKTTRLFFAASTVLLLLLGSHVNAQSVTPGKLRFGIGVDGLMPVGNSTQTVDFGLGITPRLQYGLSDKVALTFTSGIYHFFPKTVTYPPSGAFPGFTKQYKSDIIPVKVGAKVFVSNNIYLSGEVGAAFEITAENRYVHFLASPGIGYATKHWDIAARYENFSGNGYTDGFVGVRAAYGLGL